MGTVGCLPGRTIAIRREIIENHLDDFLTGQYLGIHLEISDDRTLTNYVLMDGYDSVYQSTSKVETDAPIKFKKWLRQQYRWAKGSQYNTFRMLPFMLKRIKKFWLLLLNYMADILIPLGLVLVWVDAFFSWFLHQHSTLTNIPIWLAVFAGMAGLFFGTAIRNFPYLKEHKEDLLLLIPFMLVLTFLMPFIRIWGLMRMAYNEGWGTRQGGFEGSGSKSLWRFVPMIGTVVFLILAASAVFLLFH